MIFEHEIPNGSRLYFGDSARLKRTLENSISNMLVDEGFEEIVTPIFSYYQHQSIDDETKLIKIADESNNQIALRADSTMDAVRIITKRLGRTTSHKKWFYVQPVFSYPSNEHNQIGCEWLDHSDVCDVINLAVKIVKELDILPTVQLSNINIPKLIAKELSIEEELFSNGEIDKLFGLGLPWLNDLLCATSANDLKQAVNLSPKIIASELTKLIELCEKIDYPNLIVAPLYQSSLKYYDDIYFRIFEQNTTIIKGGKYKSTQKNESDIDSLGFAIYTDNLLKILEDK